jgi:hypothetical protein
MAEGEELRTDYDPTIRPILTFCSCQLQLTPWRTSVHVVTMLATTKQE